MLLLAHYLQVGIDLGLPNLHGSQVWVLRGYKYGSTLCRPTVKPIPTSWVWVEHRYPHLYLLSPMLGLVGYSSTSMVLIMVYSNAANTTLVNLAITTKAKLVCASVWRLSWWSLAKVVSTVSCLSSKLIATCN